MTQFRNEFFIGGRWTKPASDRRFELINASSEAVIASVPEGTEADIDAAVAAARKAFETSGWADATPAARAVVMERFMAAVAARGEQIAQAVSAQNGMPIAVSRMLEGGFGVGIVQYYTELAKTLGAPDVRPSQMGKETLVERSPIGVVAAVVPWNFPVTLALNKIAPAMAAGGSSSAGRHIGRACGELLRPVTLELGGKSAAILLDDADIGAFLQGVPTACMLNSGQACFSGTRVLAPRARYAEVVDALAGFVGALTMGDAGDEGTHVGPMASSAHRTRVEGYIELGRTEGRLVAGGARPAHLPRGWFVAPTIFADVDNRARIAQEEIFGPVLAVIPYEGEDEAVRIANDSAFGLGGSVWSADGAHALDVARKVASGTVGVNGYMPSLGAPFGGIKGSGLGREFGPEAIGAYQNTKSIYVMG